MARDRGVPRTPERQQARTTRTGPTGRVHATSPREPTSLKALLADTKVATAMAGGIAIDAESWRAAVGDRIALHARPGRLSRDVLTVYASSPVWAQELSFLADDLVRRLRTAGLRLGSLRFVVASDKCPPVSRPKHRPSPEPLPTSLPQGLTRRLATVADPDLRRVIAEAASTSLGRAARARASVRSRAAPIPRSAEPGNAQRDRTRSGAREASTRTRAGRRR